MELREYDKKGNLILYIKKEENEVSSMYKIDDTSLYRVMSDEDGSITSSIIEYDKLFYLREFVSDGETFFRVCDEYGNISVKFKSRIDSLLEDDVCRLLSMTCANF